MSRNGYYIINQEQATILTMLGFEVETLGGLSCLKEDENVSWQAVIERLDEKVWEDDDVSEEEGVWLDTMTEYQNYLFWSTEAQSWV